MDYERILKTGGDNGLFQIVVFLALAFASFNAGVEISTMVIALHVPNYTCVDPKFSNQTANYNFLNYTTEFKANSTCTIESDNGTLLPCTDWIYDHSEIGNTLVTDFNLVCSRKGYQEYIYTVYFVGQVIAMALSSQSDVIGRRNFILMCSLWETSLNIAVAMVPGLLPQLALRFCRALSLGFFVQSIGLLAELITVKYRGMYLNSFWLFWCLGTMVGALFAYIGYDWRTVKLISLIPSVIYISYYWIIPESPRWLILQGRRKDAESVLKMICRWNKVPWNDKTLDNLKLEKHATGRIQDLFTFSNTRRKTIIMSFVQWSFCLCYYGLTSDPRLFSKNIYLGLFLQGLVEIPTSLFAVVLSKKFGRKRPCLTLITLTTLCLFAVPFVRKAGFEISATITAMSGKLLLVTGFIIIDCINSELYPTSVRAMGLTVSNVIGNTGNILAAYINRTREFGYFIPPVIYAIQVAICGVLIFAFIPEMSHCPLPQTVEEADRLYARKEEEWIEWMKEKSLHGEELLPRHDKARQEESGSI